MNILRFIPNLGLHQTDVIILEKDETLIVYFCNKNISYKVEFCVLKIEVNIF